MARKIQVVYTAVAPPSKVKSGQPPNGFTSHLMEFQQQSILISRGVMTITLIARNGHTLVSSVARGLLVMLVRFLVALAGS